MLSQRYRWLWPLLLIVFAAVTAAAFFIGRGAFYFGAADSDLVNHFYPLRVFLHRHLERGCTPLWNPHIFGGFPVHETQQMALYNPFNFATASLLSPRMGLLATMAIHVVMGLLLTYFALRRGLCLGGGPALAGAMIYVFGAAQSTRVLAGHFTVVAAQAVIPLAVISVVVASRSLARGSSWRDVTRPKQHSLAAWWQWFRRGEGILAQRLVHNRTYDFFLVAILANAWLVICGAPQYVIFTFYMQLVAVIAVSGRFAFRPLCVLALVWFIPALLSAPQWLPTLSYLPFSARAGGIVQGYAPLAELYHGVEELLAPFPYGDDLHAAHLHLKNVWETASWPGAPALLLLAGLIASSAARLFQRRLPSPTARVVLALLILGVLFCVGVRPPGLGSFREPLKARIILGVALSLGAAIQLQVLFRVRTTKSRRRAWRPMAFGAVALIAYHLGQTAWSRQPGAFLEYLQTSRPPFDPIAGQRMARMLQNPAEGIADFQASHAQSILAIIVFTTLLAVVLIPECRGISTWRMRLAAPVLCLVAAIVPAMSTFAFGVSRHPFDAIELPPIVRDAFAPRLAETAAKNEVPWRVQLPPEIINRTHFLPGFYETGGYDPLMPKNANSRNVLARDVAPTNSQGVTADFDSISRALGRRYNVRANGWKSSTEPLALIIAESPGAAIASVEYDVVAGMPPNGTVGPTNNGTHFIAPMSAARNDTEEVAIPSGLSEQIAEIQAANARWRPVDTTDPLILVRQPVTSLRYKQEPEPHKFSISVTTTGPAVLVVRTTALPGWTVRQSGGSFDDLSNYDGDILLANGWMIATHVPRGTTQLYFRYEPANRTAATWLAFAGLLSAQILLRRRAKKRAPR